MPDHIAPTLGVVGFVLALASLGWHVYTHYDNRRECLRAKVRLDANILFVEMWNAGRVAVYVSYVNIEWRDSEGEPDGITLETPASPNEPVHVGETRQFKGYVLEPELVDAALHRAKTIRVTVYSPHGQIAEYRGRRLRSILRELREHAPWS